MLQSSTLTGSDVVLIFDDKSMFSFANNSSIDLSGRQSGPFAGFVIATTRKSNVTLVGLAGAALVLLSVSAGACGSDDGNAVPGAGTSGGTGDGGGASGGEGGSGTDGGVKNTDGGNARGDGGPAVAANSVNLGSAASFVILAKSGITNVPTSHITGNLGVSPVTETAITGFPLTRDGTGMFSTTPEVTGKIFAADYAAPVFHVRSCIGRADDLLAGKSYYIVEVESLLELVQASASAAPHLFLLDELFRGTNAVERIAAGQAVLEALLIGTSGRSHHVALAATHDGELVDLLPATYAPYHFGDQAGPDGLTFDHRLQTGPATTRNAITLLRIHGAPQSLVDRATACAATLDRQRSVTSNR